MGIEPNKRETFDRLYFDHRIRMKYVLFSSLVSLILQESPEIS